MCSVGLRTKGFTLIASLLLPLLLSGMAIGLMMMVNTEGKVGGTDLQNNLAFHAAEGGIEAMYANLSTIIQNVQAPRLPKSAAWVHLRRMVRPCPESSGSSIRSCLEVCSRRAARRLLSNLAQWGTVSAGPNAGLYAQIIPVNMLVTAASPGGQEVSMARQAQLALIPVFQFGMFCDADCSIFPGSDMTFAGPVHANGDFYPYVNGGANLPFRARSQHTAMWFGRYCPIHFPATRMAM